MSALSKQFKSAWNRRTSDEFAAILRVGGVRAPSVSGISDASRRYDVLRDAYQAVTAPLAAEIRRTAPGLRVESIALTPDLVITGDRHEWERLLAEMEFLERRYRLKLIPDELVYAAD